MENDFLILDVTKSAIVEHAKNRIEELFGVKVGFQNCENGEISCVLQKIDASKSSFEAKVSNFNAKIIITLKLELHSFQISIALVSQMLPLLHLFPLGLPCSMVPSMTNLTICTGRDVVGEVWTKQSPLKSQE